MDKGINRLTRMIIGIMVLISAGGLLNSPTVVADEVEPTSDISLRQIHLGDQTAYGHVPTVDIWFPGYGDYELDEGSYLNLEYDHSALVHAEDSTVTVLLNDVPVSSAFLTNETATHVDWKIALPKDRLRRDINHVSVKYYMHVSHDDCAPDNPSLYSTVYDSSFIHYAYASPLRPIDPPAPDLARFPEPFVRQTATAGEIAFVLPDNASSADFSAAATVAARLGQLAGGRPLTTTLQFASGMDQHQLAEHDIVVIGQPDRNPLLWLLSDSLPLKVKRGARSVSYVDESESPIDPQNGILQEIISPWSKRHSVLVVSGGSEEGLRRAVRAVGNRVGTKPLQGQYAIVTQASDQLKSGEDEDGALPLDISLRQMGLSSTTVTGPGSHTIGFSFDSPPPDTRGGAYFDLAISYSPLIDPQKSSALVSLNGIPVSSIVLRREDSAGSKQRIPLPATDLKPGPNSMSITFFLYAPPSQQCGALPPEQTWAVLDPGSRVVLVASPEPPALDLANLPYPFVQHGTPSGTYLALPDGGAALRDSLQVAVALGRRSLGASTELQAGLASELPDEVKRDYHIIAYGPPVDNPLVAQLGQKLPLSLGAGEQRVLQKPELPLLGVKDAARLGIIELIESPWNNAKGLMIITGTSAETTRWGAPAFQNELPAGNVAIVNDDGKSTGLRIASATERPEAHTLLEQRTYSLAAIPLGLLTLGLLGLMLVRIARQ